MQSPAVMVLEAKRALPCVDFPMESAEEISAPDLRSSHGKKSAESEWKLSSVRERAECGRRRRHQRWLNCRASSISSDGAVLRV